MWPADPRTTMHAPALMDLPRLVFVGSSSVHAGRDAAILLRAACRVRTCVGLKKGVNILFSDSARERRN